MGIEAILFDKDGTLFDFGATWNGWAARMLRQLSNGDAKTHLALADAIRFDLETESFYRDSLVIASTHGEVVTALSRHLPDWNIDELDEHLAASAGSAELAEAVPLGPFLDSLKQRGLKLGVMTNDAEVSARSQLERAGVLDKFDFVAGFDSGHGMKPDPDPLLAFCRVMGVSPDRAAMVGDSTHDLVAGKAAGMSTVGVLTGMADRNDLVSHADVVLPDIGHMPGWLDQG